MIVVFGLRVDALTCGAQKHDRAMAAAAAQPGLAAGSARGFASTARHNLRACRAVLRRRLPRLYPQLPGSPPRVLRTVIERVRPGPLIGFSVA
jgi:hypothetical protein